MKENKRQHFVQVSYLKHFTESGEENGNLHVYDLLRDTEFQTTPKNVANRHKFYRLEEEYDEIDHPDVVDQFLDKNSACLPRLIKEIVETKKIPQEIDVFQSIHMQIAFLMARSPETREMYSLIHEVALAEHMKATKILETAPEVVKEYFARTGKETLDVTIKKDYLVGSIIKIAAENCEWLKARNWMVAEAPENFHFVTSDSPVTFKDIDPRFRGKYGPGLRHKHSRIFFPLTPKFALVGEFNDELPEYLVLTEKQAAIMNTQVVERPYSQIYSSQPDFKWFIPKGQVGNFDDFKSHRRSPEIDKLFRSYHKDKKEKKTEVIKTLLHDRFDPKTFNFKKNGGNTPEDFIREL